MNTFFTHGAIRCVCGDRKCTLSTTTVTQMLQHYIRYIRYWTVTSEVARFREREREKKQTRKQSAIKMNICGFANTQTVSTVNKKLWSIWKFTIKYRCDFHANWFSSFIPFDHTCGDYVIIVCVCVKRQVQKFRGFDNNNDDSINAKLNKHRNNTVNLVHLSLRIILCYDEKVFVVLTVTFVLVRTFFFGRL